LGTWRRRRDRRGERNRGIGVGTSRAHLARADFAGGVGDAGNEADAAERGDDGKSEANHETERDLEAVGSVVPSERSECTLAIPSERSECALVIPSERSESRGLYFMCRDARHASFAHRVHMTSV